MTERTRNRLYAWLKLTIGFTLLFIFCFVILPLLQSVPAIQEMAESNRRKSIDANTLFYTETSQFSEADNFFSNSNKSNCNKDKDK